MPYLHRSLRHGLQVLALLALVPATVVRAQATPAHETAPPELRATIIRLDSALFDAYNRCDLTAFEAMLAPDLEFYHDQGGLTRGAAAVTDAVRRNICGKTTRHPVAGSIEVFLMKGYGAFQVGTHRFYVAGAESRGATGEARFAHLWQQQDGTWRVTRIVSFDHVALDRSP